MFACVNQNIREEGNMGLLELNVNLTDEQKAIRREAKKFFKEVWRPAGIKLDRMADPKDVIAADSIYWDVMRESYRQGYHRRGYPKSVGGLALDPLTSNILTEEMGYADLGLCISLGCHGMPFSFGLGSGVPELRELGMRYIADNEAKFTGCWAITEPDHGSDWLYNLSEEASSHKVTPQVRAVKKGKEYIINGQKSAWVSNGTLASHALLFVAIEPAMGLTNCGVAIVPMNRTGVSRGKPLNKMGQRSLNQGEIFFDDVHIPQEYMVWADPKTYQARFESLFTSTTAATGMPAIGCAQAAFDEAYQYCQQRVQGGKTIFEHQSVKARLFDMFIQVEAARSLSRRVSAYNAANPPGALQYSIAVKILGTETAFRVASMAIQLFGGYGVSKDFLVEKLFRDARASMIEDGVNETLALEGAERLR
jgi:alkylation response protein AidB-like acyl-CoA dehydrogenase